MKLAPLALLLLIPTAALANEPEAPPDFDSVEPTSTLLHGFGDSGVTVVLRQQWLHDPFCWVRIDLDWTESGEARTQRLLDDQDTCVSVSGDLDGLLLLHSGSRYEPEGWRTVFRYRYDRAGGVFYRAESWAQDDWTPYRAEVRRLLDHGNFTAAHELVAQRGTTPNGGHSSEAGEIFVVFASAAHREAMRAWKDGHKGAATDLALDLLRRTPVRHEGPPADDDQYILEVGPDPAARTDYDVVVLTPDPTTHELVNDLAFFLDEGGHHELAVDLLRQVVRLAPDRPVAHLNLADALWATGDKKESRAAYRTYVDLQGAAGGKVPERARKRAGR